MEMSYGITNFEDFKPQISGEDFRSHLQKPNAVVFVDLDGVDTKARLALLRQLIGLVSGSVQPKVFFCYSIEKVTSDEIEQLRMVSKKTNWYIFEKPLALAQLFAAFHETQPTV